MLIESGTAKMLKRLSETAHWTDIRTSRLVILNWMFHLRETELFERHGVTFVAISVHRLAQFHTRSNFCSLNGRVPRTWQFVFIDWCSARLLAVSVH